MNDALSPAQQYALQAAEQRGYHAVAVGEHGLRVVGRFGEPTLGAVELMVGAEPPLGVLAEGREGHRSALCLWTGDDLYAITLGEGGRWEHFRVDAGLGVVRDSWRGGARARYRVPHGPLVQPIPQAIELAEAWGFPRPETHQPVIHRPTAPPRPAAKHGARQPSAAASGSSEPRSRASRPSTAGATRSTRATRPEDVPKICPTCYTALPATGFCDFCA